MLARGDAEGAEFFRMARESAQLGLVMPSGRSFLMAHMALVLGGVFAVLVGVGLPLFLHLVLLDEAGD